jgi:hypothetical protein
MFNNLNIHIYNFPKIGFISEYLKFNQIPYTEVVLWNSKLDTYGRHCISDDLLSKSNQLLIIDLEVFCQLIEWEISHNQLSKFLQQNHLMVGYDGDSIHILQKTLYPKLDQDKLVRLNQCIPPQTITWVSDILLSDSHWIRQLSGINLLCFPSMTPAMGAVGGSPGFIGLPNAVTIFPRIFGVGINKTNASKDFLLTTINRRSAMHRKILWEQISCRPGLLQKGHAVFNTPATKSRIGLQSSQLGSNDSYPSMDLYLDSWLEVVPETLYKNGYYITEKTGKPIVTRTPFLMLSTKGYLQYLKNLGFKTFDTLISEKYDEQHRVQDRARLLVDQLEDITKNGAESFYRSSKSILDHNYLHLAQMVGTYQHNFDNFLFQCFYSIDQ